MRNRFLISITLLLICGVLGNILRFTDKSPDRMADFSGIPTKYKNYIGVEVPMADFADNILKADITTLRDYITTEGRRIQFFAAYFKSQKYGSQIHSPKHCLPGGGWRIDKVRPFRIELNDGTVKDVNLLEISVKNYKAIMLYWFETRSGSIRDEYGLKFDLVKNAVLFNPTDAAIIRLTIDASDGNFERATQFGVEFLNDFYPLIEKSLPF